MHLAERRLILTTLAHMDGNKTPAPEVLGISVKTLYNRLHEYGRMGDEDGARQTREKESATAWLTEPTDQSSTA